MIMSTALSTSFHLNFQTVGWAVPTDRVSRHQRPLAGFQLIDSEENMKAFANLLIALMVTVLEIFDIAAQEQIPKTNVEIRQWYNEQIAVVP